MVALPSRRAAALAAGAVIAVLLLALAALWLVQRGQVLPNTSVAGVEVSGLDEEAARDRLSGLVAEREDEPVVVGFEDATWELEPAGIDFAVDLDATVEHALSRGRQGLPGDAWERVRALWHHRDLDVVESWDHEALDDWVDATADEIDRETSLGSVEVDPETLEVTTTLPQGAAEVRRDELTTRVVAALRDEGPREIEVPADTTDQPVADAVVEDAAAQVEHAVAEPLVLRVNDSSLTVEPADLARLLQVRPTSDEQDLELVVTEDAVEDVLAGRAAEAFDRAPRSARYTASRTPPTQHDAQGSTSFSPVSASVGIEPGVDGRSFEPELAAEQLTEVVREGSREVELRMATTSPELSNEDAEALRPSHLIGTFTTYYQAGQTRNANIQLLADVIDHTLVLPGEQFSINDISGSRSCEKGYEPAGTIVRGELVDTCGGGTSQFGTTTFNAAFFAGVQLDQWRAHSWYISRYPMGREATLSYPQLDVRFTNTTDGAILVKTAHTSTSVTVSLYGQPLADVVRASHGSPTDERSYDTETRTTADLPQGEERVLQSGTDGFTVNVTRTVERTDGSVDERTITTVYQPQTRIIERGTGPSPAQASEDPDEPDPDEPDPEEADPDEQSA